MFDVISFLKKQKIEFTPVSSGKEIVFSCPVCGKEGHFYLNLREALGLCHRCGWACNAISLILALGLPRHEAYSIVRGENYQTEDEFLNFISSSVEKLKESIFPKEILFEEIYFKNPLPEGIFSIEKNKLPEVFLDRKIPFSLIKDLDLFFCEKGNFGNRIIVPTKVKKTKTFFGVTAFSRKNFKKRKELAERLGEKLRKVKFPYGSFMSEILYNFEKVKKEDQIFVVEGFWDLLRLRQYGYPAVSCFGSIVSFSQAVLLSETDASEIVLMLDGDVPLERVRASFSRIKESCFDKKVSTCLLPENKDPDECSKDELLDSILRRKSFL